MVIGRGYPAAWITCASLRSAGMGALLSRCGFPPPHVKSVWAHVEYTRRTRMYREEIRGGNPVDGDYGHLATLG